ncbi:immune inhibitor A domain-containing protein [Embleya sp. AB8]|uniref:immune inhibitor A domain-containing protein n=1 Tax=Embleya sp. AB8 TaxID=3156304 RepID=UPI003C75C517
MSRAIPGRGGTPPRGIRRFRGPVTLLSVSVLAVAGLTTATGATSSAATARVDTTKAVWNPGPEDQYLNTVEAEDGRKDPIDAELPANEKARRAKEEIGNKNHEGNPRAASQLRRLEAESRRTGKSPEQLKAEGSGKAVGAKQEAKLLTILVEFNDQANDDFSGFNRRKSVDDASCVVEPPGTLKNGPLHNTIPDPALTGRDNNSQWTANFSPEHYNKMLYTKEGITERMRKDLTGPDGKPGIDLSGYTMKNMYEEMSGGKYTVTGTATPWIKVPHSEAWYAAGRCGQRMQDMGGHPKNPLGAGQLAIDAVDALAKAQPNFPWADYDKEDPGDANHNGNTQEPDGVVDHLVLVHAGKDKSAGGGAEGSYAIWAHSSSVPNGYTVPGTKVKIANYIVQPEDSGVGVVAHEYGHDLGLPDLYDNFSGGSSDVNFWDLMASGSHSGPLFQSMPAHMSAWSKYTLGWLTPKVVNTGGSPELVTIGQAAKTPRGTQQAVRVNLPDKVIRFSTPHSGSKAWYSSNDQNWADVKLVRDIAVPTGSDVKFQWWSDYALEEDWDFGFVEVSTDGGTTWKQLEVRDEAGTLVSTPPNYPDPNGNLRRFGKTTGLTGSTNGWRHDRVDLTPYAGQNVKLRLGVDTDAATQWKGWLADDFSLTNGTATVWSDDVEGGDNGWTAQGGSTSGTRGAGWVKTDGTFNRAQYYLLEWRNTSGFDQGLKYTYTFGENGKREKIAYNAPGLLVWLRSDEYENNGVANFLDKAPSWGAKGELLLVDSHPDPYRFPDAPAAPGANLETRVQSANAAFGFRDTSPFRACRVTGDHCASFDKQAPVRFFTDALGYAPGAEASGTGFVAKDAYGSTVVPARAPYSTRVTKPDGSPDFANYGKPFSTSTLGSGNPGWDKAYGVTVFPLTPLPDNQGAVVFIAPSGK